MKVLYLKEEKTNKPDMMGCAIMDTFSQSNDIVNVVIIDVNGSIQKTVVRIKELVKQYKPDILLARNMLASIALFELPKTINKIIINPFLLFENSEDYLKLKFIMDGYTRVRMQNWLCHHSTEFVNNSDPVLLKNAYCVFTNKHLVRSEGYIPFITKFNIGNNSIMKVEISDSVDEKLKCYTQIMTRSRLYFEVNCDILGENIKQYDSYEYLK